MILVAAVVVCALLAGLAVLQLLLAAGRPLGAITVFADAVGDIGIWVVTGYFSLGVPVNAICRSRPERLVMTPVVLLLALSCLVVALG
ncbi:MAG TPA: hypothetical protein VGB58_01435 [Blastococcus sp.]